MLPVDAVRHRGSGSRGYEFRCWPKRGTVLTLSGAGPSGDLKPAVGERRNRQRAPWSLLLPAPPVADAVSCRAWRWLAPRRATPLVVSPGIAQTAVLQPDDPVRELLDPLVVRDHHHGLV